MTSVMEYLEAAAQRWPECIAVTDGKTALTYRALLLRAKRIGAGIAARTAPRTPVGLYLGKTPDAVCAIWGVIAAGCFYCVLNPELPQARLDVIAGVLQPRLVITQGEEFSGCPSVPLEQLESAENADLAARRAQVLDIDPLYVNFTSGSTGTPKGIAVGHRSVIDFIGCFTRIFGIDCTDVIANQAPFDFDVSVKDIYSAAATGATLAVVPRALFSQPAALMDFLCDTGTTTMIWAVSALCLLTTFHALDYRTPPALKRVLFSGEVLPQRALKSLRQHLPEVTLVNLYGPTEITCNCTYHIVSADRDYSGGIPIGRPFPNEDVFLLDSENRRVTDEDEVGEICVRGTALALGYFRNPEQTALHFVQNPLCADYPELIYRTGDLARYNALGELVFAGRKDFQIKYLGHRIELEEIERAMGTIGGVEACCCLFDAKHARLKGFYVGTVEPEALHAEMRRTLPGYMVPGLLRRLDALPLSKNGKIDRALLGEMK